MRTFEEATINPPNREIISARFLANMRRIGSITKFIFSQSNGLEQKGIIRSEGVQADLMRAVVVFLHATFEDYVRSHLPKPNKRFTLYSKSDIRRALHQIKVDPALFENLFPLLTKMAERRKQIVHHADLPNAQSTGIGPWTMVDLWQLIQWHLAVAAFYHRLRRATGPTSMVEDSASQNAENALIQHVELARELLAFSKLPPEQHQQGIPKILETLENIRETLKLEVEMFLDPDGKPIEGAISAT